MRKIAIASSGTLPDAPISELAARAPYIQIYDEEGNLLEVFNNPFAVGGGGAGVSVAKVMHDKGVTDFVATRVGPNFEGALASYNIKLHIVSPGLKGIDALKSALQ